MAVPQGSFNLFNRSVMRVQGGYFFFISSIIALTAVKTIVKVSNNTTSAIMTYSPPFTRELKQPPPFLTNIIIAQYIAAGNKNKVFANYDSMFSQLSKSLILVTA